MGRSSSAEYWLTQAGLDYIEGWVRRGLRLQDVAVNMGVSDRTLRRWAREHQAIEDAIQRGKAPADFRVESALYTAAIGQKVTVKKPMKVREIVKASGKGEKITEKIVYADEEIYIPPDPRAGMHWLRNRDPERWNVEQRAEVSLTGTEGDAILREIEAKLEGEAL